VSSSMRPQAEVADRTHGQTPLLSGTEGASRRQKEVSTKDKSDERASICLRGFHQALLIYERPGTFLS
jgi:hypothetical protein